MLCITLFSLEILFENNNIKVPLASSYLFLSLYLYFSKLNILMNHFKYIFVYVYITTLKKGIKNDNNTTFLIIFI